MNSEIIILGGSESGVGAAILAKKNNMPVFVSDCNIISEPYKNVLKNYDIAYEEGGHSWARIKSADTIIKSPGISEEVPMMKAVRKAGIKLISELEFGFLFTSAKIIGITGSNGKTTTARITYHILKNAGLNVGLAGNVGHSFAKSVALEKKDVYVLEISSFQLDDIHTFRPDIAVILNITPDHLDRYDNNYELYKNSKFRICKNQTSEDHFVFCLDDPQICNYIETNDIKSMQYAFSLQNSKKAVAKISHEQIIININNNKLEMNIETLALQGKHNIYNSMAAGISSRLLDINKNIIKESLADFQNIEHRLEFVLNIHGIEFINDSKATNVNATWYALECMQKPVVWIAGGQDKGNDYDGLKELVAQKVKAIVCLGIDNEKIIESFSNVVESIVETYSANDAVNQAYRLASPGDIVLLSPACASFDLFDNFEERGRLFKAAVKEL